MKARDVAIWVVCWLAGVSVAFCIFRYMFGFSDIRAAFYALGGGVVLIPAIAVRVFQDRKGASLDTSAGLSMGDRSERARGSGAIALTFIGAGVAVGGTFLVTQGDLVLGGLVVIVGLSMAFGAHRHRHGR